MCHILLLNIKLCLTLFPGIILLGINLLPKVKRFKSLDKYVLSLVSIIIFNFFENIYLISCFIILILLFCFLLTFEYLCVERKNFQFSEIQYIILQVKRPLILILIVPVMEELVYRTFLYTLIVSKLNYHIYIYVFLSTISFIIAHYFQQRSKSLLKIPIAIILCILYLAYQNIFICIFLHLAFNCSVYFYNLCRYEKNYRNF